MSFSRNLNFGDYEDVSKRSKNLKIAVYTLFAFVFIFSISTIISFIFGSREVEKSNTVAQSDSNLPSNNTSSDNYTPPVNTLTYVFNVKSPLTISNFVQETTFAEKQFLKTQSEETSGKLGKNKYLDRPSLELDTLGRSVAMTRDASNIVSSFPEFKAHGFAQVYQNIPNGSTVPAYTPQEIKLTSNKNTINIGPCNNLVVDTQASYIGTMSNESVQFSVDGTQMYVSVLTNNGSNKPPRKEFNTSTDQVTSPFGGRQGKVLVYQRQSQINLQTGVRESSSNNWTMQCKKVIQTQDLSRHVNDFIFPVDVLSDKPLKGDQFGQVLKTSVDWRTRRRCVAARKLYPETSVVVYEENLKDNTFDIVDKLVNLDKYMTKISTNAQKKMYLKQSFGYEFAVANNVMLISCQTTNTFHVAFFYKSTYTFEFVDWLSTPDTSERFGHSMKVRDDGKVAIISAPSISNQGGSVYVYSLNADKKSWTKRQTLQNLDSQTYNFGVFGAKVNMDSSFRILTVLLNVSITNSTSNLLVGQEPNLLTLYFDNTSFTIVTETKKYLKGPTTDRMWGFAHALQVQNNADSGSVKLVVGSPIDKKLLVYSATANTS